MTTSERVSLLLALLSCCCSSPSNAFINTPAFAAKYHRGPQRRIHDKQSLELSMIDDSLVQSFDFTLEQPQDALLSTASQSLLTIMAASQSLLTIMNPSVEAEVLTDMSHVMMDFSGFFTPSRSLLRCFSVVGRILVLSADYLPDHTVHPEELAVQLFLLAYSLSDVLKALMLQIQHGIRN